MNKKTIFMAFMAVLIIIISMQNIQEARFNFFFWTITFPMIVFIIILLLLGFLAGYIITSYFSERKNCRDKQE